MSTFPPVPLTLAPEAAYRVHFLALASAGRASLAYASRLLAIAHPAYAERVAALPCGAQDGEADRTESLRASAEFAWELARTVGESIRATYPAAIDGEWGKSLRDAADQCRELVTLVESIPTDRAELLSALRDTVTRCRDELHNASDDMYL
jgi:hypothetical protein